MTYITHIVKVIFKAYKKTNKLFLVMYNLFVYKNDNKISKKKAKKDFKKKHLKDIKIFQKKTWERYQNVTEEEKEKKTILLQT